eukprot:6186124-Pleurochrysis_carterae.AAC.2
MPLRKEIVSHNMDPRQQAHACTRTRTWTAATKLRIHELQALSCLGTNELHVGTIFNQSGKLECTQKPKLSQDGSLLCFAISSGRRA